MDRNEILEHLTQTERHIGASEFEAAQLRQDLTRRERAGNATVDARQALQRCEESRAVHWMERARLLAELSKVARC